MAARVTLKALPALADAVAGRSSVAVQHGVGAWCRLAAQPQYTRRRFADEPDDGAQRDIFSQAKEDAMRTAHGLYLQRLNVEPPLFGREEMQRMIKNLTTGDTPFERAQATLQQETSKNLKNVGAIIDEMVDPRKRAIATATIMASLAVLAVGFDCVYLSYTSQM